MKEKQEKQLKLYTRTCTKFQVHILRIEMGSSSLVPRAMFLHLAKLPRSGSTGCTTSTRSSARSARNGSTRSTPINKEKILAATHQYEVAARQYFVHILTRNHEAHTCRCKFGNSNMKQTRDFPRDKGSCYRVSLRKQIWHWHTVSDRERQLQKFLEPWKEAGFVELALIQHASRHWRRLSWK